MISSFLFHYYSQMQARHPAILWRGISAGRAVALTFDDGPHPRDTPRVLEVLAKYQVQATFFLVGQHAERHPELVRQIARCRHQLALHCYRHRPFPFEQAATLQEQLAHTRKVISAATEIPEDLIRDVRPPYGIFDRRALAHLTAWDYRLVMWNCMPPHWMQPVRWSIRQIMRSLVPGAVIVLHDGHGHGRRVAEILDAIVPRIQSMGYGFVSVEHMQREREQLTA